MLTDKEFINTLIKTYLSNAHDAHQAIIDNGFTSRLNTIADKLDKYKEYQELEKEFGFPLAKILKPNQQVIVCHNGDLDNCTPMDVMGLNIPHKTIMVGSSWDSFFERPLNEFGKTWWFPDKNETNPFEGERNINIKPSINEMSDGEISSLVNALQMELKNRESIRSLIETIKGERKK